MSVRNHMLFFVLTGVLSLSLLGPHVALADNDTPVEQTQEYQDAKARLEQISNSYQALAQENSDTLDKIDSVHAQMQEVQSQIEEAEEALAQSQNELNAKQELLGQRMAAAYKSGAATLFDMVLGADSFEGLISAIHYMDRVAAADAAAIDEVNAARAETATKKEELEAAQEDLEAQEEDLQRLSEEQSAQMSSMNSQLAQAAAVLQSLSEEARAKMEEETGATLDSPEMATAEENQQEEENTSSSSSDNSNSNSSTNTNTNTSSNQNNSSSSQSQTAQPSVATPTITSGGSGTQAAVIAAAHSTPTAGLHQCSLWVRNVFLNAGQPDYGNTAPYKWYNQYCFSSNRADLQPGMIICTSTLPFGTGNGHVGIYIGDGLVMHNTSHWVNGRVDGSWVATVSVDDWIRSYGVRATPRWGWLGGIALN